MACNLTINQVSLITAVRNFQHLHGYTPSVRELAGLTNRARGTVFARLKSLEKKGILRRHAKKARAIEIVNPAA